MATRLTWQTTEPAHDTREPLHRLQPELWLSVHLFAMTATVLRHLLIDLLLVFGD